MQRLKNSLSVEHPIPGDELRAIKRYLATRTTSCPGCSSPSAGSRYRQAVNYLIGGWRKAGCKASIRTCCGTRAATTLPTGHRSAHHAGLSRASRPQAHVHYTRVAGGRFEGFGNSSDVVSWRRALQHESALSLMSCRNLSAMLVEPDCRGRMPGPRKCSI